MSILCTRMRRLRWRSLATVASVIALVSSLPSVVAAAAPLSVNETAVVASQGDAKVTLGDVDVFAQRMPEDIRARLFSSPDHIAKILKNLLSQKQLLAEARALKLQNQPQVQAQMQAAANKALIQARIDALNKHVEANVPDLDELAHERYLANPDQFRIAEQVTVKHILIGTKDRSDTEAKALADKLAAELKSDPSGFAADVDKFSDDPSKKANDGVIKDATSNKYVPAFREAAAKLKHVGDVIGPVKSPFGYHIIKLVKITPARQRSFAEVHDVLVEKLRKDYIGKTVQNHLDLIRSRKVDANPELVASLRTRYGSDENAAKAAAAMNSGTKP